MKPNLQTHPFRLEAHRTAYADGGRTLREEVREFCRKYPEGFRTRDAAEVARGDAPARLHAYVEVVEYIGSL